MHDIQQGGGCTCYVKFCPFFPMRCRASSDVLERAQTRGGRTYEVDVPSSFFFLGRAVVMTDCGFCAEEKGTNPV